jgi:hypothetical protein
VRPRCEAPRMPMHSICSRWVDDEPVAERAHASVKPVPSYPGVRSPPLQERRCKVRWPRWGNPEMTRKAVFSEGRGLRVRVARPDASRGIPFPPGDEARGRLAYRAYASVKPVPSLTSVRSPPLHRVRPLDILNFGREGPRPSFGPVVLTFVPGSGR